MFFLLFMGPACFRCATLLVFPFIYTILTKECVFYASSTFQFSYSDTLITFQVLDNHTSPVTPRLDGAILGPTLWKTWKLLSQKALPGSLLLVHLKFEECLQKADLALA